MESETPAALCRSIAPMSTGRVLIAGGGIAGLSLRAGLHGTGWDVEVVERNATWSPTGGGIAMQPNAIRALHELGVGAAVEAAGARIGRWVFRDQAGEMLCEIDLPAVWGDVGPFVGIARTALHDALLAAAPGGWRLGTAVRSLRDDGRSVEVTFGDGTTAAYDLVVGADGIHSTVRGAVFGGPAPVYGGQMVWRSLASTGSEATVPSVQFWVGDGCFFGSCPVDAATTYGFANVTGPRRHDPVAGRLDRVRRRFAGFAPAVRRHLAAVASDADVHCSPIEWLPRGAWRRGRVVLLGDAAHACSPMMGQGGSVAIEDALVLARELDDADDVDAALDAFVRRRAARVAWVHEQSQAVGGLFGMPPAIRNDLIRRHGAGAFAERYRPLAAPLD